jgi:predicted RNase H-like HicB family nuclease
MGARASRPLRRGAAAIPTDRFVAQGNLLQEIENKRSIWAEHARSSWTIDVRYPIAIEPGSEATAFGVVPGCFSAGDTLEEAVAAAEEAAATWIEAALEAGEIAPAPSSLEALHENPDYAGWTFAG